MFKFEDFSTFQRAVTIAGLGPAMLVGCTVHGDPSLATYLPAAYGVSLAFPWGDAKAKASAWKPTAPAPRALDQAIRGITNNFEGLVGVAVTSIDDGWIVASNGERPMPQQSVSKLWVAVAALDALDRGAMRLNDPVTVTRADLTLFHQPIRANVGAGGYATTIGALLNQAMTRSDNTANDKLLWTAGGPEAVRSMLVRNGISGVRFGPGERLLQSQTAGLSWKQSYSIGDAFFKARNALPLNVREAALRRYLADPIDGASPEGITLGLAGLARGNLLSPASCRYLLGVMENSKTGPQRMRAGLAPGWTLAHKTGTGQELGGLATGYNDVGLVTAPDGRAYAIAVMIGRTTLTIPQRQRLMSDVVRAVVADHDGY